ncbi:seryl-tRNA synthetase [Phenylobacterium zucineum HLK1]|uniref:Serine--tRNA ligase n=1 Tax=Phenylobacterium zucineum (strain HLK1) TaxID=450851 RepID=SYS_PHEZH|nr:serine--tRNA ligase [Phenylobacterium zucineum]B4RDI1.1 RecName: Full=Serine--tRNA ligase; AltName: Full=Seryl-tRNA synthetase; Short=SerRS; AltName: Full=Seryl-tRNA(Ser/Sec) synthetase [Phenylobacterium zucineum HLK1]ACG78371.1 seryl-tRNA synthetase [Phenylobacterium zucineum HLK1]
MHDIRAIRETPELYEKAWAAKGSPGKVAEILKLDEALRAAQTALQAAQAERNEASKKIGQAKAQKDEAEATRLMAHVETLKKALEEQGEVERSAGEALRALLAGLPNIPAAEVPDGADEHDNVEVRRWGEPRAIAAPKDHATLGEAMGLMDFEAAARMSGARFVVLKGQLARLERALGQFMLDLQTQEHGYTEVNPPLLVNDAAAYGTDKLPKFAEDLFQTTDGRWLIPTAEVPLTSLVMGQIVAEEELPLRYTALTPCFRSEAGASGRDTRGMIRQHQFNKVELVSITTPEQSADEHERMVGCAEAVLKRLELPFRTMLLCRGDMGFGARKTYDLEVWLPSQEKYREISSCSNTGDFQARRMDARAKKAGEKGTRYVHTLNGSGLAVGRTLVAVLENYQDEGGRIAIPEALRPYMPGMTHIGGAA